MKFAPLFCSLFFWATVVGAEPAKKATEPARPLNLPVIEIHDATPIGGATSASNSTYELPPIEGQKAEKLTVKGRSYWGGPYGMPAGPGRAWPSASAPGTPGAPGGGLMTPAGIPSRF